MTFQKLESISKLVPTLPLHVVVEVAGVARLLQTDHRLVQQRHGLLCRRGGFQQMGELLWHLFEMFERFVCALLLLQLGFRLHLNFDGKFGQRSAGAALLGYPLNLLSQTFCV